MTHKLDLSTKHLAILALGTLPLVSSCTSSMQNSAYEIPMDMLPKEVPEQDLYIKEEIQRWRGIDQVISDSEVNLEQATLPSGFQLIIHSSFLDL